MRKGYIFLIPLLLSISAGFFPLFAAKSSTSFQKSENSAGKVKNRERIFTLIPPKKWQCIEDKEALPLKVDVVYVGASKKGFTPSINIATEEVTTSLLEYCALARKYHESQPETKCHSLGSIESKAGAMQLLQIDRNTEWGDIRFLQASIIDQNIAYVFTATCLSEEYENYYAQFLQAIQSFDINHQLGNQK